MNYPRIAAYSQLRSNGQPLVDALGKPNMQLVRELARYPLVTLDLAGALYRPQIAAALRAANPAITILGYQLITHFWKGPNDPVPPETATPFNERWHRAIATTNGWSVGAPAGYEVDWSRDSTAHALSNLVVEAMETGQFDGAFLDYCDPDAKWPGSDNVAMRANMGSLTERISQLGKDGSLIVHANGFGARTLPGVSALMFEGFPVPHTDFNEALFNVREGDWLKCEVTSTSATRLGRFTLGTACLTGAMCNWAANRGTETESPPKPHDGRFWLPEYDLKLGEPTGDFEMAGHGCYRRDFQRGVVIVNPTNATQKVTVFHAKFAPDLLRVDVPAMDSVFLTKEIQG